MTVMDVGGPALVCPDEMLEALTAAVVTTLREMAGVESSAAARSPAAESTTDVSVALRTSADVERWLILRLPQATAAALARRVLAAVGGEPDQAMVRDCAGELLNVIAGQAKAILFGHPCHFTFTTPMQLTAGPPDGASGGSVIRFASDAGEFTLQVCASLAADGDESSGARPGS
jgi:CheY-specific phosphatase CheX